MTIPIVTAGSGQSWETGVVAALTGGGAPCTVVRRCADLADVLATASTGQIGACLVAAHLRRLDSETVARLAAYGVAVVAVHRAGDETTAQQLARIGVAASVADDTEPAAVIAAVTRAVADRTATAARLVDTHRAVSDPSLAWTRQVPPADRERSPGDPGDAGAAEAGGEAADDGESPRATAGRRGAGHRRGSRGRRHTKAAHPVAAAPSGPGTVIAVWGPKGAPGRSTVALGLADAMVRAGRRVVLLDADVYGGVLASALGLLDESAGLAGACRLAANGRLDEPELARLAWRIDDGFTVLTGIARADRWPEVRPSAIPTVLGLARSGVDAVIVDCADVLETDEEITFDTMAPRRNGATLAVLAEADTVVAVGSADPPGVERLARALPEVTAVADRARVEVVLNRVRPGAASGEEAADALRRFCGATPVARLPEDRAACDLAWRRGEVLSAAAPRSPLVTAFHELARALTAASPTPRRAPRVPV